MRSKNRILAIDPFTGRPFDVLTGHLEDDDEEAEWMRRRDPSVRKRTTTPGHPQARSEDPFLVATIMLGEAMYGVPIDKIVDDQCEIGSSSVSARGQLPINGSPGYRERRGRMEPVVLEGAEDRLKILKAWLVDPELPPEDVGRVTFQIEELSEDIECARVWKAMGFEFGTAVDGVFRQVRFPVGWKQKSTDHPMYSDFVDERGRKRLSMFYKTTVFASEAWVRFVRRFSVMRDYDKDYVIRTRVLDAGVEVFSAEPVDLPCSRSVWDPEHVRARQIVEGEQRKVCCAWLEKHYPNYNDPTAHWDT